MSLREVKLYQKCDTVADWCSSDMNVMGEIYFLFRFEVHSTGRVYVWSRKSDQKAMVQ